MKIFFIMNRISASLVLYNTDVKMVQESINSYFNSSISGSLWIIDNSEDAKYKYLDSFNPNITYVNSINNLGYGRAHNIALRNFIEKTDYHIILNPDISFNKDVIEDLVEYLDSNNNIGLVAPKAVYPDGTPQSNGRLIPSPIHLILRRFFSISKLDIKINHDYELKDKNESNYLTPVVLGSFMMFRNLALKKIGLFDERFFLYPEDIDISRRMFEKYDNIIYVKKQFIHHHYQESYKNNKMLFTHIKEMIKYFNKWGWIIDKSRKKLNLRSLKLEK